MLVLLTLTCTGNWSAVTFLWWSW